MKLSYAYVGGTLNGSCRLDSVMPRGTSGGFATAGDGAGRPRRAACDQPHLPAALCAVALAWAASAGTLVAEEFSWKDAQGGSYGDKGRWLMNQGGVAVQAPRPPGSQDRAIMRDGEYMVTVNGQETGTLFAASDNTFNITGGFMVGTLVGSPQIIGSGTLALGDWSLSPSAPAFPNAVIDGAQVMAGTFRMPGSNLGVEIANGGRLQCTTYVHGGGFGTKPVKVRGFGSHFEVLNDVSAAPELQIHVSEGASATLAGVLGTPGTTGLPEFYINGDTSQLNTADLTTNHLRLTDGGDATTSGDAWLSGFNNEVSAGSRWRVSGKLSVLGVFGKVLGIHGGGSLVANELEADRNAELILEGAADKAILFVESTLTKKLATLRVTDGLVVCGTANLLPGEASLGQVPVDMTRSIFNARETMRLDSWARFQGEDSALATQECRLGTTPSGQGRLEMLPGSDFVAASPLIVGDLGRGTVSFRGAAPTEPLEAFIGGQAGATGLVSLSDGAIVPMEGAWVVGYNGNGTLTLTGESALRMTGDDDIIAVGGEVGSEGLVTVEGGAAITNTFIEGATPSVAFNASLVVGDKGKGTLVLRDGAIQVSKMLLGHSFEDNSATLAPGPGQAEIRADDCIVGDGGRARMKLEARSSISVETLKIGDHSSLESTVSIDHGASLTCAGIITIGDEGRGSVVCSGSLRSNKELQVAITQGAVGYLEASGPQSEISGETGRIVLGGGPGSSATAVVSLGGRLFGANLILPPPPTGAASLTVTGAGSQLHIFERMDIGHVHRSAGPATCTVAGGATAYAGRTLMVGPTGVLNVTGGGMVVSPNPAAPVKPGFLRVESGARTYFAGTLIGGVEIASGAAFSPGASPGTSDIQGALSLETGSRLDLEIGGAEAGTEHDMIKTSGALTVRSAVRIRFINGFAPSAGQSFTLVRSTGALTWDPSHVVIDGLQSAIPFTLTRSPAGLVTFTATAAGLPASQPSLDIQLNIDTLELSWPAVTGWILEQSAPGLPIQWSAVPAVPPAEAGYHFLTRSVSPPFPPSRLFRLRKSP
jgi:T5SS/PEP-CTERM-associated repeat protein